MAGTQTGKELLHTTRTAFEDVVEAYPRATALAIGGAVVAFGASQMASSLQQPVDHCYEVERHLSATYKVCAEPGWDPT
ncbi:MAG: hypothetical protein KGI83_03125, partial [Verrucomicrobiota bacterium]|nr:hypothetical protein [Verrucomicrobiota bacterium]